VHDDVFSLNESSLLISASVGAFTFAGIFLVTHGRVVWWSRSAEQDFYALICVDLLGFKSCCARRRQVWLAILGRGQKSLVTTTITCTTVVV